MCIWDVKKGVEKLIDLWGRKEFEEDGRSSYFLHFKLGIEEIVKTCLFCFVFVRKVGQRSGWWATYHRHRLQK